MASIFQGIGNIIHGAVEAILGVIGSIWHLIVGIFSTFFSAIQGLLNAVFHTFEGLISTVLNVIGDIVGIITANIIPVALVGVGIIVAITMSQKSGTPATKKKA